MDNQTTDFVHGTCSVEVARRSVKAKELGLIPVVHPNAIVE